MLIFCKQKNFIRISYYFGVLEIRASANRARDDTHQCGPISESLRQCNPLRKQARNFIIVISGHLADFDVH
jgi:hypothetical protein